MRLFEILLEIDALTSEVTDVNRAMWLVRDRPEGLRTLIEVEGEKLEEMRRQVDALFGAVREERREKAGES